MRLRGAFKRLVTSTNSICRVFLSSPTITLALLTPKTVAQLFCAALRAVGSCPVTPFCFLGLIREDLTGDVSTKSDRLRG